MQQDRQYICQPRRLYRPLCNGVRDDGEECDDANSLLGDCCSSSCIVELGYACSRIDNTSANPDVCSLLCGNGALDDSEDCDDNNLLNNDGCDASCKVEEGYDCQRLDNTSINPDICTLLCGNGALEPSEECDDYNTLDGDGCTSTCIVESGYSCSRIDNTAANPDVCSVQSTAQATCGNGIKEEEEECDPGEDDEIILCNECMLYKYTLESLDLTEDNDMSMLFASPFPNIEANASCKWVDLLMCRFYT